MRQMRQMRRIRRLRSEGFARTARAAAACALTLWLPLCGAACSNRPLHFSGRSAFDLAIDQPVFDLAADLRAPFFDLAGGLPVCSVCPAGACGTQVVAGMTSGSAPDGWSFNQAPSAAAGAFYDDAAKVAVLNDDVAHAAGSIFYRLPIDRHGHRRHPLRRAHHSKFAHLGRPCRWNGLRAGPGRPEYPGYLQRRRSHRRQPRDGRGDRARQRHAAHRIRRRARLLRQRQPGQSLWGEHPWRARQCRHTGAVLAWRLVSADPGQHAGGDHARRRTVAPSRARTFAVSSLWI
jgi:hypothetical protein